MTLRFVIPTREKTAYYANARQRATLVMEATADLINLALSQGYALHEVTDQQKRDYGVLAQNAHWVMTLPDGSLYFAESVFQIGTMLNQRFQGEREVLIPQ